MLYGIQVHLLRVESLRGFLEPADVDFILRLERSPVSSSFYLSLIYAIIVRNIQVFNIFVYAYIINI
jgi:hypothetical protein